MALNSKDQSGNWKLLGTYWLGPAVMTLAYWVWESQAAGNIRIDLLLIYPILFGGYLYFFRPRFRWFSILMSLALLALDFVFFVNSYSWFQKPPG